jgi:hypothetical protein
VRAVHALVFLIDIVNLDFIFRYPTGYQLAGIVGRTIVYHHPNKIGMGLRHQTIVYLVQTIGSVKSWGKDGNGFHSVRASNK